MRIAYLFGLDDADRGEIGLFLVTICALVALVVVGIVDPPLLSSALNGTYNWVMHYFGWWFMALGGVLLVFGLFMTLSRYGKIRIGGEDAEPEFGLYSWISMVFTVGFGSSIVTWGVGEPVSIVNTPPDPMPVAGTSIESLSLAFMFLHESFPGMAMWYIPVALSFALMVYTRSISEEYKLSSILDLFLDRERYGWLYWIVDLSVLIAMVGGIATSLGFTAQQLSAILGSVYGLQADAITYGLFAIIGLIFLGDIWLGLRTGIQNAARLTIVFMLLAIAMLLAVGPTLFTLNLTLDATGVWLNNVVRLMFYTGPTAGDWAQQWTSFWWGWWAAWGLFVGSFVARVSKGRTIRETFFALVVVPSVLVWFQHGVLGGWVLSPAYFGPVRDAYVAQGIPAAVAEAITLTPFGSILGLLLVLVMVGYLITTLDSAVFMLSAITLGNETPNARNRAWWGVLLAFLGIMTLNLPSFDAMRSFSPVMALPFTLYFLVLIYASYITARDHYREKIAGPDEEPFFTLSHRPDPETSDASDGHAASKNDD